MNLEQLKSHGGIVAAAPHPVKLVWSRSEEDGGDLEFTVHIKKWSAGYVAKMFSKKPDDSGRLERADMIANSVFLGDDGSESIPYETAIELHPDLFTLLANAVLDFNGVGKELKNSPSKMKSGTS